MAFRSALNGVELLLQAGTNVARTDVDGNYSEPLEAQSCRIPPLMAGSAAGQRLSMEPFFQRF